MGYLYNIVSFLCLCAAMLSGGYSQGLKVIPFDPYSSSDLSICQCPDINDLQDAVAELQQRLDMLEDRLKNTTCEEVWKSGVTESGVYTIYPFHDRSKPLDVYCDFTTDLQSWMTFQRRMDGSENFYRYWDDYVNGFGTINREFWMGLETLHQLTSEREYELRVDMEDFEGEIRYAKYSTFKVGGGTQYTLQVYGYSGNAGDSMFFHNGKKFTTRDKDQDNSPHSCASEFQGAWWYDNCHSCNPNGLYLAGHHDSYADGVEWGEWHGFHYSLKRIEFKIRVK